MALSSKHTDPWWCCWSPKAWILTIDLNSKLKASFELKYYFLKLLLKDNIQRLVKSVFDSRCKFLTTNKNVYVFFCSNSAKPLDVVAIDNLHVPSLLPRESSVQFAESITPYLLKLPEVLINQSFVKLCNFLLLIHKNHYWEW